MELTDGQKKLNDELEREARLRKEISESLTEYVKAVKDSKKLAKEIASLEAKKTAEVAKLADMQNGIISATVDEKKAQEDLVAVLEHQNEVLRDNKRILDKTIDSVNKYQLASQRAFIKGGKEILKTFLNIDNVVKNAYSNVKGLGLFEMDKAIKQTALSMGLAGKQSEILRSSIKSASENTVMFGAGIEELAKYQAEYSEELGRSVMLGQKGLESIAAMAKGTTLGAEGAAKMAAEFEQQGYSAERTKDFIEETVNKSAKMGLNSSKVIKNMQQNMKLLNKYNFKGGVKGLQKMAETTSKLGVDMNFATGMAEKLFDIEGAVEMSAQLQVMGGAWANLADPFHLMYMARNDMAGLTEEIGKAAEKSVTFKKESGTFEISALEMHRLRKIAEQTGISYEELATAAKNAAKFTKIKGQVSFNMNETSKKFLENTAQLDEKGRGYIEMIVDGKSTRKYLNELDDKQVEGLMGEQRKLEERAKEAMTFDDTLKALTDRFKMALLPFVEKLGEPGGLADSLQAFIEKATKDGWFTKISEFASKMGEFVTNVGKVILPIIEFLGPGGTLAAWAALKAATWIANGVSLGIGFNSVAGKGGLSNLIPGGKNMSTGAKMMKSGRLLKGASTITKGLGKAAAPLAIAGLGIDAYQNLNDEKLSTGEAFGKTLDQNKFMAGGAAIGAGIGLAGGPFAPVTVPAGMLVGAGIGGIADFASSFMDNEGLIGNYGTNPKANDAILSGGKITPIDNKDELMAFKKGGPIDKMMGQNTGVNNIKHEFGELRINGKIEVTSPGNSSTAVDLMRNPQFIRELQIKISQDLIMKENQVLKRG